MIKFITKTTLTAVLLLGAITMFAQTPFSGSQDFRKFSIGINAGALTPSVITGGSNDYTKSKYTLGYGANLKYQFTHYFALQANFLKGKLEGDNTRKLSNGNLPADPNAKFSTDLKYAIDLAAVFTFGNINWLSKKSTVVPYVSLGGGYLSFDNTATTVNPSAANQEKQGFYVPVGAGLKFNLSNAVNLDLGYKANFYDHDNLNGTQKYGGTHKDKFSYMFLGLEFALGKPGAPQLMFDNPAARVSDMLQTQVSNMQTKVDALASQLSLTDSDGDGVPDQFDKEPNTPAGYPVDFRGVSLDTDGDGVPDGRDKEKVTPTNCQPVDADGVGTCPVPACCSGMGSGTNKVCNLGDMPSISFSGNSSMLSDDAKVMLSTVATKMKANPNCTITVTAYPASTKASQAVSNARLNAIKNYLSDKEGITKDRVMTTNEVGNASNTVDVRSN